MDPKNKFKHEPDPDDFTRMSADEAAVWYAKGADYTIGNAERLYNFTQTAELTGMTARQAWSILFLKHVFAVLAWAKTGKTESEGICSRFIDIANYAKLGRLIAEAETGVMHIKKE